jgi:hypothetical protein
MMPASQKSPRFSRRALLRLAAAFPVLSILGLAPRHAASDEIVQVGGWILRRSDLRWKDRP